MTKCYETFIRTLGFLKQKFILILCCKQDNRMVKSLAKSRSIACICGSLRTQLWMHRSGSIDHTSKTIPAFRPIVGARVSLASDYGRGRLLSTSGRCASASEVPIANKIEDTTENAEKLNTKPKRIKMKSVPQCASK